MEGIQRYDSTMSWYKNAWKILVNFYILFVKMHEN